MQGIIYNILINNRKTVFLTCLSIIFVISMGFAENSKTDDFVPGGKPFVKLHYNFHTHHEDGHNTSAFEFKKAILGYKYYLSDALSIKACVDVGNPKNDSKFYYTVYLKNAFLNYHKNGWSIDFGMIRLKNFEAQEDHWGSRYIEKPSQDLYKIAPYADLGFSVSKHLTEKLEADFTVRNGEGYTNPQLDKFYNYGLGASYTPISSLFLRAHYEYTNKKESRSVISGFACYSKNKVKVGIEYAQVVNEKFQLDHILHNLSSFATYSLSKKFELFARYDHLSSAYAIPQSFPFISDLSNSGSASGWNADHDGSLFISGIQYTAVKGVKVALNYKGWQSVIPDSPLASSIYLNFEFAFK